MTTEHRDALGELEASRNAWAEKALEQDEGFGMSPPRSQPSLTPPPLGPKTDTRAEHAAATEQKP